MSPFNAWLMFRPLRSILCFMSTPDSAQLHASTKKSYVNFSSVELQNPLIPPPLSPSFENDIHDSPPGNNTTLKKSSSF